jgi:hypothetical protein
MCTAETLVPKPGSLKIETAIKMLKSNKLSGTKQILTQLIQTGGKILHSQIHKLINSIWNKEDLPQQWKESIIVPIHKKGDNRLSHGKLHMQMKLLGTISVDFHIIHQLLIRYSAFIRYWRKNGSITDQYISH